MNTDTVKKWIGKWSFPLRMVFQERRALLSFVTYVLLMASYYLIRPTRSTIFLEEWGAQYMPIFYLLIAAFTLGATFFYNYLVSRFPRAVLIRLVFLAVIVSFLFFWTLYSGTLGYSKQVTIAWYIWICVYILFLTSLFWSFNHDLYTPEESKLLYPLILLGAQIGVILGAKMVEILVKKMGIGTYNLIGVSALMLLGVLFCLEGLHFCAPHKNERRYADAQRTGSLRYLGNMARSPYALSIAAIVVLGTFSFTICDLQYKRLLEKSIQGAPEIAEGDILDIPSFLNDVNMGENIVSLSLKEYLSAEIKEMAEAKGPVVQTDERWRALVKKLNRFFKEASLHRECPGLFSGDHRLDALLAEEKSEKNIERINRLFFDKTFKNTIVPKKTLYKKDTDARTVFLAGNDRYMGWFNILMLFIVAPILLSWLGPGWTISLFPIATIGASFAFLKGMDIQTAAWYAVLISVLNYTLYLVGKESFYVPTDKETRYQIKAVIDTFGYRLGDALGGLTSVVYLAVFGTALFAGLSACVFVVSLVWFPSIVYAHKKYGKMIQKDPKIE